MRRGRHPTAPPAGDVAVHTPDHRSIRMTVRGGFPTDAQNVHRLHSQTRCHGLPSLSEHRPPRGLHPRRVGVNILRRRCTIELDHEGAAKRSQTHSVYWDGRIFRLAIPPPSPLPVEGVVRIVPCPLACMDTIYHFNRFPM